MTKTISTMPDYLKSRPTQGGFIVPWFVTWYDAQGKQCDEREPGAKANFPVIDYGKISLARKRNLCWICGNPMGSNKAFVFGPSSAIIGISTEPPSHLACAGYAVTACPFLTDPRRGYTRQPKKEGEAVVDVMSTRNPGLSVIWVTKTYELDRSQRYPIFRITGQPVGIQFWKEKRRATYKEVADAMQEAVQIEAKRVKDAKHVRGLAFAVHKLMAWAGDPP